MKKHVSPTSVQIQTLWKFSGDRIAFRSGSARPFADALATRRTIGGRK